MTFGDEGSCLRLSSSGSDLKSWKPRENLFRGEATQTIAAAHEQQLQRDLMSVIRELIHAEPICSGRQAAGLGNLLDLRRNVGLSCSSDVGRWHRKREGTPLVRTPWRRVAPASRGGRQDKHYEARQAEGL